MKEDEMKTDFSKFKLQFDLDDIVRQFDCIAGVAYQDNHNENQLLVPTMTVPKCDFVDCLVYDKKTMKCDPVAMPFNTEHLGQPIGYFPPESKASVVPVKHWDAYYLEGKTVDTHQFSIDDKRDSNGQVFLEIKPTAFDDAVGDDEIDPMLAVTLEINTSPFELMDHVPCAHVHFDDNRVAFSLYKVGNGIALISETDVEISVETSFAKGYGEQVTWFK
jgi:hypothetical protein